MTFTDIKRVLVEARYKIISMEKFYILEKALPFNLNDRLLEIIRNISTPYAILRLTTSSKDMLNQYMGFKDEVRKENVKEWLDNGHICLSALVNNKIIGSVWISTRYPPYFDILKIRPIFKGTAYIFKLFVSPNFRGKGIGTILVLEALQLSYKMGITRATAIVHKWNKNSLGLMEKLGFKKSYKLYFLKLGTFKQCFLRHR
jgi:ribosomal protein S18 acetylase RimI-like enzyme